MPMPFWQRAAGGLLDAFIPGNAFDRTAESWGQGWHNGDYANFRSDPAARGRVLSGAALGLLGPAGSALSPLVSKGITRYYNGRQGSGDMGPPTVEQQYGYNYLPQGDVGPPAPQWQTPQHVTQDEGNRIAGNAWNQMNANALNNMNQSSNNTSLANGGSPGFGFQGTSNIGGTMALLNSFGAFGPSMADIANTRWYRNKVN